MKKLSLPPFVALGFFVIALMSATILFKKATKPNYAQRLQLPSLPAVRVLAPYETPMTPHSAYSLLTGVEGQTRSALTPAAAQGVITMIQSAQPLFAIAPPKPGRAEIIAETKLSIAYLDQAAQIKRSQLENGDSTDSTGEVEERLHSAHQAMVNMDVLESKLRP